MEIPLKQVNISQFLRGYESKNTRTNYLVGLKQFFTLIYARAEIDIKETNERLGVKMIPQNELLKILDV
ncbi:MAG: hypothetical protein V3V81_05700, partial [Candidatus Bathyarchaeia archaeon]